MPCGGGPPGRTPAGGPPPPGRIPPGGIPPGGIPPGYIPGRTMLALEGLAFGGRFYCCPVFGLFCGGIPPPPPPYPG